MKVPEIHVDQLRRKVAVYPHPKRIISLVPSQTELLYELGLGEKVAGITKFCVHPKKWHQHKVRVGGTKNLNFGTISQLHPDLVIANKEENNKGDILRLQKQFPVWVSDVNSLPDALDMIQAIAKITATDATALLTEINGEFDKLLPLDPPKKALYLIWKDPYMAAGTQTFINDIMQRTRLENAILETRYPSLSEEDIKDLNPDVVLLSSEPYPFAERHIPPLQKLLPETEIKLVDGEMFSWYGSRLRLVPEYLNVLLH